LSKRKEKIKNIENEALVKVFGSDGKKKRE